MNWAFIRSALRSRRFARDMKKQGYTMHETDWEIIRGGKYEQVILDVKIDVGRKHIWVKIGEP